MKKLLIILPVVALFALNIYAATYSTVTTQKTGTQHQISSATLRKGELALAKDTGVLFAQMTSGGAHPSIRARYLPGAGAVGPAGPAGSAATVTVGSTTTGAAGTSASVTNSGTSSAAVLQFTIPQGATGPAGADGSAGPAGPNTVTTATTTNITGILRGNGSTVAAATGGSDYARPATPADYGSGTPSASTYLRGDGTWATVSGGGSGTLTSGGATSGFTDGALKSSGGTVVNAVGQADYPGLLSTDSPTFAAVRGTGSASAPFIGNYTETNTGIYFAGTGTNRPMYFTSKGQTTAAYLNGRFSIGTDTANNALMVLRGVGAYPGTVSTTAGGTSVTPSGAVFANTFRPGDTITINGETRTISAVSAVSLTTDAWTNTNTSQTYSSTTAYPLSVRHNGVVSIGAALASSDTAATPRLTLRGFGATASTFGLAVQKYDATPSLTVDDAGNVGVGTATFDSTGKGVLAIDASTAPITSGTTKSQLYSTSAGLSIMPAAASGTATYLLGASQMTIPVTTVDDQNAALNVINYRVANGTAGNQLANGAEFLAPNISSTGGGLVRGIGFTLGKAKSTNNRTGFAYIHVGDGSASNYFNVGGFYGSASLGLNILPSGNVGIGTAAPTSKLHVVGLPVYANNAAAIAGGLTAGAFYRTGADPDPVCVVH